MNKYKDKGSILKKEVNNKIPYRPHQPPNKASSENSFLLTHISILQLIDFIQMLIFLTMNHFLIFSSHTHHPHNRQTIKYLVKT